MEQKIVSAMTTNWCKFFLTFVFGACQLNLLFYTNYLYDKMFGYEEEDILNAVSFKDVK